MILATIHRPPTGSRKVDLGATLLAAWLCSTIALAQPASPNPPPMGSAHKNADSATNRSGPSSKNKAVAAEFNAICQKELATSLFFGSSLRDALESRLSDQRNKPEDLEPLIALAEDAFRQNELERGQDIIEQALALLSQNPSQQSLKARLLTLQGMGHFLAAEDANCLAFNNAASCILPVQPEAVHRVRGPIKLAIESYQEALDSDPTDPEARWLLNLSHMLAGTYPEEVPEEFLIPPERFTAAQTTTMPRMRNVASVLGVDVLDLAGGAVVDDFDGDGFLDLVSSSWDPCSSLHAFRSNGVDGFEDMTSAWGLDVQLGGLNLVHADVDNDGALDLLVLRGAWNGRRGQIRNSLLLNRIASGEGFVDATYAAGLAHPAYPTQAAAFSDYDLDGDLDLYVGNESASSSPDFLNFDVGARPYPAQLFQNLGTRNGVPVFRDVARSAGVQNLSFAKGVAWGDIDNDGDDDLFVANLGPNRLYINLGNGRFEDRAKAWGVSDPSRSFVSWFFDYDNDGDLDLFNGDYSVPTVAVVASLLGQEVTAGHPRLYRNDGDHMTEISQQAGMSQPLLPMGANYGDLDGDGYEDIYIGTGLPEFTAVLPNVFFHNEAGKTFTDATFAVGLGHLQKGHAVAFSDLDHDGDLDLFEQLGGAYPYDRFGNALYLNPLNDKKFGNAPGHRFLSLDLHSTTANNRAVGARIAIVIEEAGKQRTIHRVVSSGGSFGGSSYRQEVGLGQAEKIVSLTIRWPGSRPHTTPGRLLQLDHFYRVEQSTETTSSDSPVADIVKVFAPKIIRFRPQKQQSPSHDHHR